MHKRKGTKKKKKQDYIPFFFLSMNEKKTTKKSVLATEMNFPSVEINTNEHHTFR